MPSSKSRAAPGRDLDLDIRFQLDLYGILQIHIIEFLRILLYHLKSLKCNQFVDLDLKFYIIVHFTERKRGSYLFRVKSRSHGRDYRILDLDLLIDVDLDHHIFDRNLI